MIEAVFQSRTQTHTRISRNHDLEINLTNDNKICTRFSVEVSSFAV